MGCARPDDVLGGLMAAALALAPAVRAQEAPALPVLTVTADVRLEPGTLLGGIVIAASHVTVEGAGARVVGPVQHAAELAGAAAAPDAFTGTGVRASGVDGVTLRGLRVQGFGTGLLVEDARGWTLEDCDLSDNFHDPAFGWGERGDRGGLVLRRVHGSTLLRVRANRTWDACSLVDSDDNTLVQCDFSRSSNTCLKLWHSSRNVVTDCNLSWGLRIAPGEVHARDSTCVLIESGSDDNHLLRNDATHGGDGIFVRVLNNWPSTGNLFEANDVSYANNNGFEAWSPGNTYVGNVANHCSYGFWLGASDGTVLVGNEAGWNGDPQGFHNAPESFGHGGIVFVNGPSNHTRVEGNLLHHNAGGGLVLRGDEPSGGAAFKAFHWVIQDNHLEANRWGVWMRHADFLELGPNSFAGNTDGDVHDAGNVTRVVRHEPDGLGQPGVALDMGIEVSPAASSPPGTTLRFTARDATRGEIGDLELRWAFGDGREAQGPVVEHAFARRGSWRVALLAHDPAPGGRSGLASAVVCVTDPDELPATEGGAATWAARDASGTLAATFSDEPGLMGSAVHARLGPWPDGRAELSWPAARDADLPLTAAARVTFWIRARNPNIPAWQDTNPVVTLHEDDGRWLQLVPRRDWLGNPPDVHFRDAWMPLDVPLAGDEAWTPTAGPDGAPSRVRWITIGLDTWGTPALDVWLDGLALR